MTKGNFHLSMPATARGRGAAVEVSSPSKVPEPLSPALAKMIVDTTTNRGLLSEAEVEELDNAKLPGPKPSYIKPTAPLKKKGGGGQQRDESPGPTQAAGGGQLWNGEEKQREKDFVDVHVRSSSPK